MSISGLSSSKTSDFSYSLNKTNKGISNALSEVASGKVADLNSANKSISDMLKTQVNIDSQGIQNGNIAIGMLQIAGSALSSLQDGADQLNQLSVKMGNGILNSNQKEILQQQGNDIKQSMQQSINSATYNGQSVFGSFEFNLGTGQISGSTVAPDPSGLDITDQQGVADYMKNLSSAQSDIGSQMNGIGSSIVNSINQSTNLASSSSQISDTDFSQSILNINKNSLKLDAQLFVQAHNISAMKTSMDELLR